MKKLGIRILSILLCLIIVFTLIPMQLVGAATEQTTEEYQQGVKMRYTESFENSDYYDGLQDESDFLYKIWANNLDDKGTLTKAYLWGTQWILGRKLDSNAYMDYLVTLLAMMETSFATSAAAQARYNTEINTKDLSDGLLNISAELLLGDDFKGVKNFLGMIDLGEKGYAGLNTPIEDIKQLTVLSAAAEMHKQKMTVLNAILENTEDKKLKKAVEDTIHICNAEYVYIACNIESQFAKELARGTKYVLFDLETYKDLIANISKTVSTNLVPWLNSHVSKKAGGSVASLLVNTGKFAAKLKPFAEKASLAIAGLKIGVEFMKLYVGDRSECYREMLAMDQISNALAPAFKKAKETADSGEYEKIVDYVTIGKALTLTHMRGDYCNVKSRTYGSKKDGAEEYLDYLEKKMTGYEASLARILEPENLYVVHDKFELYDKFISPVTQQETVPDGWVGISSFEDLQKIAEETEKEKNDRNALTEANQKNYILMDHIVCPSGYESIPVLAGCLDGNGYSISNVSEPLFVELIGGEVRNLGIVTSHITDCETHTPEEEVVYGVLACKAASNKNNKCSVIDNCYLTGSIKMDIGVGDIGGYIGNADDNATITNCYNDAEIEVDARGYIKVGGIIGSGGYVSNCYNSADIEVASTEDLNKLFRTKDIDVSVGGISGWSTIMDHCYNEGNIQGGAYVHQSSNVTVGGLIGDATFREPNLIYNCFNTGSVRGYGNPGEDSSGLKTLQLLRGVHVGGIVGMLGSSPYHPAQVINCWNGGVIEGGTYTGGIAGLMSSYTSVTNCFNAGNVTSELAAGGIAGNVPPDNFFTCCYNAGNISGTTQVGALVGNLEELDNTYRIEKQTETVFTDCYYQENGHPACGTGSPDGIKKFSADQMNNKETFSGFDFNMDWKMGEGMPLLRFSDVSLTE